MLGLVNVVKPVINCGASVCGEPFAAGGEVGKTAGGTGQAAVYVNFVRVAAGRRHELRFGLFPDAIQVPIGVERAIVRRGALPFQFLKIDTQPGPFREVLQQYDLAAHRAQGRIEVGLGLPEQVGVFAGDRIVGLPKFAGAADGGRFFLDSHNHGFAGMLLQKRLHDIQYAGKTGFW